MRIVVDVRLGRHEGRQQGPGHSRTLEFVEGVGDLPGLHGFVTLIRAVQARTETNARSPVACGDTAEWCR